MTTPIGAKGPTPVRTARKVLLMARSRRGVVSVLAMMFVVLFGSLVAAMGISSQGNLRAASTHLHVMRAMGAAETGMAFAEARLREASSRFIIAKSDIDASTASALWSGNTGSLGDIVVLDPPSGHAEAAPPSGLAEAIALIHAADENIIVFDGIDVPVVTTAPAGTDTGVYQADGWVVTPLVALGEVPVGQDADIPAFQVIYAPLANGVDVRAIVVGYDFGYRRQGQPLTRVITQDFRLFKRVEHAVISPSKLMIGKNVHIEGNLGAAYEEIDVTNGEPLVLRSDFAGLDDALDAKLTDLYEGILDHDIDGDNRLRVGHPIEDQGIPNKAGDDYGGDPNESPFSDITGDGFVDEFDVFINHYDANGDGRVVLSDALKAGTPAELEAAEFVDSSGNPIDDQLALLLDGTVPDRNRNGIHGFYDFDSDGAWDAGVEPMLDYDPVRDAFLDQELGFRDGAIDAMDRYAKVNGSIDFRVSSSAWNASHGDPQESLQGGIHAPTGENPLDFNVGDNKLPDLDATAFVETESGLRTASDGDEFWEQVASQLGVSVSDLPTYEETRSDDGTTPLYFRLDPDADHDGLPDNSATAHFEKMPFNSPNFSDWYYRPVFRNMRFYDTQIPMGLNALFVNCEFIGVTWVRAHAVNTHPHWTNYGRLEMSPTIGVPAPAFERTVYGDDPGEDGADAPPMLPASAIPPNQVVLLAVDPLDKGDILDSQISTFSTDDYNSLPDPLIIDGKRVTDTRDYSNNLRFHDCLFVGSIVSDTPTAYTHVRNKMQYTGKTRFLEAHPDAPDDPLLNPEVDDLEEIAKSSMMLPNYSVDIGSFNSPPEQHVSLKGAIIAGVLDVRGNASIDGSLMLTFQPKPGEGPLVDVAGTEVGNPAGFNTTLGYFGIQDGDGESIDPADLPLFGGQPIVGWDVDGDGLPDIDPDETPPDGAQPVPFHGYGRVEIRFDPNMTLPDGIMLPLRLSPLVGTYREGTR